MKSVKLSAFAKVNLFLDITNKRTDGFHDVVTVLHSIELHDTLKIRKQKQQNFYIHSNKKILGVNILDTLYERLIEKIPNLPGFVVRIKKMIPMGGGLGGGSSDAAVFLNFLNTSCSLNMSAEENLRFATLLGSDVPFFDKKGTQIGYGKGEILEPLSNFELFFVLIVPEFSINTKESYSSLRSESFNKGKIHFNLIKQGIAEKDITLIGKGLYNIFEIQAMKKYPILQSIKLALLRNGAVNALMSGTGSSIFGVYENRTEAKKSYLKLKKIYKNIFFTKSNV